MLLPLVLCRSDISIFIPCQDALFTYVCATHFATSSRILQAHGLSADLGSVNCRNRFSILTFQSIGKFFKMPKTTKAAPPQQSTLDMWRKKKKVGASKVEPDAMDVEIPEEKQCKRVWLRLMILVYKIPLQWRARNARGHLVWHDSENANTYLYVF